MRAALVVIREPAAVRAEPMEAARAALAVAPFSKKDETRRDSEYRKRGKIHEENEESIGSIGHGVYVMSGAFYGGVCRTGRASVYRSFHYGWSGS